MTSSSKNAMATPQQYHHVILVSNPHHHPNGLGRVFQKIIITIIINEHFNFLIYFIVTDVQTDCGFQFYKNLFFKFESTNLNKCT